MVADGSKGTAAVLALLVLLAGACSLITGPDGDSGEEPRGVRVEPGIVFISMRIAPDANMDALFEGRVSMDSEGCLRLGSADGHTVVWPRGYDFDAARGAVRILDADGEVTGRAGDRFRLPGGEVTSLHEGLGFTDADRTLADTHCPGRYWIVAS